MITFFKNIKIHLDTQWHFLILAFKRYELTTLILYRSEGFTYGFELFTFESPKTDYDTYCLLGLTLFTPSKEDMYLELRLLWLFAFTISLKLLKLW